jgi:hypothetical protein
MAIHERIHKTGKRVAKGIKNGFIPHEGNGHKPHILRPRTIVFALLIAFVAEAGFLLAAFYIVPRTKFFGIIDANALVDETNQQRVNDGLQPLAVSPLLTAAAQDKANNMVQDNYFAHTSPTGVTPWYWFGKVGYAFSVAGENLAVNFTDSQAVTNAWMQSPDHRANILDAQYTQVGIATAQGTYDGKPAIYVAEEFGTPAAAPIAFVNAAAAAESAPTGSLITVTVPANETVNGTVTQPLPQKTSAPQTASASSAPRAKKAAAQPVATVPAIVPTATAAATSGPVAIVLSSGSLTLPATETVATQGTGAPAAQPAQENFLQRLVANPGTLTNDFYFALIALFGIAVLLNVFIKFEVQFPRLVFGGMAVIVVAGFLVLFNQNLGIFHAVIL